MSVEEHLSTLRGLPVVDFPPPSRSDEPQPEPGAVAWRLRVEYEYSWDSPGPQCEEDFDTKWHRFRDSVDLSAVRAIVFGAWDHSTGGGLDRLRDLLVDAAEEMPALRAVFLGDLVRRESDIAYLRQCDPAPLLAAFPALEEFGARGGRQDCGPLRHAALRRLRFESGGLPAQVVQAVAQAELPNLESLELWFGVEEYGGTARIADLAPLLDGSRFPKLRHLWLGDSEMQDEIAAAVASAPVVAQLETLSLALGTLGDEGAEALLHGQPLTHLKRLDLHHHFLTDPVINRLRKALEPAGVELDLSEQQLPEEDDDEQWRYVAVAE